MDHIVVPCTRNWHSMPTTALSSSDFFLFYGNVRKTNNGYHIIVDYRMSLNTNVSVEAMCQCSINEVQVAFLDIGPVSSGAQAKCGTFDRAELANVSKLRYCLIVQSPRSEPKFCDEM